MDREREAIESRIAEIRQQIEGIVSSEDRVRLMLKLWDLRAEYLGLKEDDVQYDSESKGPTNAPQGGPRHPWQLGSSPYREAPKSGKPSSSVRVSEKCLPTEHSSVRSTIKIHPGIYGLTVLSSLAVSSFLFVGGILLAVAVGIYLLTLFNEHGIKTVRVVCLLSVLFVGVGISHDILLTAFPRQQPTALCVDGHYSYSAHRQGTCSWHGGVSEWYPAIQRKRLWLDAIEGAVN